MSIKKVYVVNVNKSEIGGVKTSFLNTCFAKYFEAAFCM